MAKTEVTALTLTARPKEKQYQNRGRPEHRNNRRHRPSNERFTALLLRLVDSSGIIITSLGKRDLAAKLYFYLRNVYYPSWLVYSSSLFARRFCHYSRLSLSQIPRNPLNHFEISVPRHIRFSELRKKLFEQPH